MSTQKLLIAFIFSFFSITAFAESGYFVCKAENLRAAYNKTGTVKIQIEPFSLVWISEDRTEKTIFGTEVICGRSIAETSAKPVCRFTDQSTDNLTKYAFSCESPLDQGVMWFARGGLSISKLSNAGRFDCATRYGNAYMYNLNLTSCQAVNDSN